MSIDLPVAETMFWRLCQPDFPQHTEQLRPLLAGLLGHLQGKVDERALRLRCRHFFEETGVRWPRYEAYLREWPAEPQLDDDDEPIAEPAADCREMGELLMHRIVMAYYAQAKRLRLLDNATDRPVWRLVAIEDGRTPQQCIQESRELHHWRSEFWRRKQLPCERLFCRCGISACTVKEAAQRLVDGP